MTLLREEGRSRETRIEAGLCHQLLGNGRRVREAHWPAAADRSEDGQVIQAHPNVELHARGELLRAQTILAGMGKYCPLQATPRLGQHRPQHGCQCIVRTDIGDDVLSRHVTWRRPPPTAQIRQISLIRARRAKQSMWTKTTPNLAGTLDFLNKKHVHFDRGLDFLSFYEEIREHIEEHQRKTEEINEKHR